MVSLTAPYVSGFLAFREAPFLADLVRRLREKEPDLLPQARASSPLLPPGGGEAPAARHHPSPEDPSAAPPRWLTVAPLWL